MFGWIRGIFDYFLGFFPREAKICLWGLGLFDFLGLFPREAKICLWGLDSVGKTTLLHMLQDLRTSTNKPTFHPRYEELMIGNIRLVLDDPLGQRSSRWIWKEYFATVKGIVFIVDAADRARFSEAREELHTLLDEPSVRRDLPVAVLGNKIDIPVAASEDELRHALGLEHHTTSGKDAVVKAGKKARPLEVFMCCVVKRTGFLEAFEWLSKCVV